jgi:hypothetical protein
VLKIALAPPAPPQPQELATPAAEPEGLGGSVPDGLTH